MLKSWLTRPFQSEIEATTNAPNTTYTARVTVAARSGRSRQRPANAITTDQSPTRKATHSENCPSSVMEISGLGHGLVAGTALGEHVGGADDSVPSQPPFHHDLDVVGVRERVGNQAVVGDRIGLHPVRHLEIDGPVGVVAPHRPGHHLRPDLE